MPARVIAIEYDPNRSARIALLQYEDGERRIDLMALSAPTPESERTTHYFFGFVRNFGLDDPTMEQLFSGDMVRVFNEDIPVLEAQQRMREMKPEAPALDIKVDAAPLAARRMLAAMLAHEAAK